MKEKYRSDLAHFASEDRPLLCIPETLRSYEYTEKIKREALFRTVIKNSLSGEFVMVLRLRTRAEVWVGPGLVMDSMLMFSSSNQGT